MRRGEPLHDRRLGLVRVGKTGSHGLRRKVRPPRQTQECRLQPLSGDCQAINSARLFFLDKILEVFGAGKLSFLRNFSAFLKMSQVFLANFSAFLKIEQKVTF